MRGLSARVLLLLAMCFGGIALAAPAKLESITTNEGAVAVRVTPRSLQGAAWEFEVTFDTHSQDLKDDMAKAAVLVAADGREVAPLDWRGAAPGGHHRSGILRFPALEPAPAAIVLRLSRPGEAKPRIYRWNANRSSAASR